ncbi:uncharacterized protein MELLADRAFT_92422 [Melampsora larici-populina 98AG31]|uniref:Uncharacterized protein n=1 Tax=Melampsora larici-populina (strain 98AG31 / pathotype 3-4-7) TaxID=747676 RepID=F4R9K9_MELLP|nr:uncharacterized protein MELLADRAFT_92422 [Melampsora larici-populina 98AG31]EGG10998.1 hypothetical protein MELLADRAFT_92422 [Melampsora larici-populina 98AG31]
MCARGFWWDSHYWCKVVRTFGGLSGVWHHNDMQNEGIATLSSRDLSSIGGVAEHTSWVMYSRAPTAEEASIIVTANVRMNSTYGDQIEGDLPFSQVKIEKNEAEAEGLEGLFEDYPHGDLKSDDGLPLPNVLFNDSNSDDGLPTEDGAAQCHQNCKEEMKVQLDELEEPIMPMDQDQEERREVPAKPKVKSKRKVCNLTQDEVPQSRPSKKPRVDMKNPVVTEAAPTEAHSPPKAKKPARPQKPKGWKGYALVDVEELNAGSHLGVDVSSQESNGRFKLWKSKRHSQK